MSYKKSKEIGSKMMKSLTSIIKTLMGDITAGILLVMEMVLYVIHMIVDTFLHIIELTFNMTDKKHTPTQRFNLILADMLVIVLFMFFGTLFIVASSIGIVVMYLFTLMLTMIKILFSVMKKR